MNANMWSKAFYYYIPQNINTFNTCSNLKQNKNYRNLMQYMKNISL